MPETEGGGSVRLGEQLPEERRNRYWQHIKQTLHKVFEADVSLADEARARLERLEAEKGPQTLFYHAGPLEVAANLSGAPIGPEQRRRYLGLSGAWASAEQHDDLEKVAKEGHLDVL